jgi:hypothetical protein
MVGFSKSFTEYTLGKKSDTKLDAVSAIRFQAKAKLNGKNVILIVVTAGSNRKFIGLMMLTPVENSERDVKTFEEILLRSFKFDKQP